VVEIDFDDDGQPHTLQMTTGAELGFGSRTIELSGGGFSVLRSTVVLDFTADALKRFPEIARPLPEK
jgi:hypothetical protein